MNIEEQKIAIKAIVYKGSGTRVQDEELEACMIEQLQLALVALSSYRGRVCGAHRRVENLLRDFRIEAARAKRQEQKFREADVIQVSDPDYGYGQGRYQGD